MCLPYGHLLPVDNIPDIQYSAEMGVTHGDFFRILPSAMGEHEYQIDGSTVRASIGAGSVEIHIGAQQERRIALMCIPFAKVSFHFRGVSKQEQQRFKAYFDLRFQRGGG